MRKTPTREDLEALRDDLLAQQIEDFHGTKDYLRDKSGGRLYFDMNTPCEEHSCGTAACIGGLLWLRVNPGDLYGADAFVRAHFEPGSKYHDLFWPPDVSMKDITELMAGKALDNFLKTGDPNWEEVLKQGGKP